MQQNDLSYWTGTTNSNKKTVPCNRNEKNGWIESPGHKTLPTLAWILVAKNLEHGDVEWSCHSEAGVDDHASMSPQVTVFHSRS